MQKNSKDGWDECPPGTIAQLGHRLRKRRLRHKLIRATSAVGAAAVMLGVGVLLTLPTSDSGVDPLGNLTCAQVAEMNPQYSGAKEELSSDLRERFEIHVRNCPLCSKRFGPLETVSQVVPIHTTPLPDEMVLAELDPFDPLRGGFSFH